MAIHIRIALIPRWPLARALSAPVTTARSLGCPTKWFRWSALRNSIGSFTLKTMLWRSSILLGLAGWIHGCHATQMILHDHQLMPQRCDEPSSTLPSPSRRCNALVSD